MKGFYKNKKKTTYSNRNKYVLNRNKKRVSAKKRKLLFRFFLFFFLILLIIINIYYLFFVSSIFKIESVDIYIQSENINNDYSDIEENINFFVNSQMILESSYFKNKKQDRLFLFDKSYLKEKIQNEYKNILHDINIYKKYPDRLKIELKKRIPAILFISFDGRYYTDKEGYIVYKIKDELPSTSNITENLDEIENSEIDNENIEEIKEILKEAENFVDISDYYNLNDSEIVDLESLSLPTVFIEEKIPTLNDSKLVVTTDKNYNLYFNLNKDPEKQVRYLNIFLSEREENEIRGINYIDLRFDSRIFYK